MQRQWTQDEIDDDQPEHDPSDFCEHGVGFDETCEWCDYEESGPQDLEAQLDAALGWVCKCRKRNSLELSLCAACGHRKSS